MLKRISAVLMAVVMLFTMTCIATVASAEEDVARLVVTADKDAVKRGEDVVFTVAIADDTVGVSGLIVELDADAALTFKSWEVAELDGENKGVVEDEDAKKVAWASFEALTEDLDEGKLLTVTYTAAANATLGDAALTAEAIGATYNAATDNIDATVTAGVKVVTIECAHNFEGAEWAQPAADTAKEDAKHTRECTFEDCTEKEEEACSFVETGVTKHTETVPGAIHWECEVCGYTCDTEIPAGHNIVKRYKAATGTQDGEWQEYCTICEEVIDFDVIPAGHPGTDVTNPSAWYYDEAAYAKALGLMSGNGGKFSPNNNITRAEVATIVAKMYYLYTEGSVDAVPAYDPNKKAFTDVPAGNWAAKYVQAAAELGIVNGTTPTTFAPTLNITNQEIAALFYGLFNALDAQDVQFAPAGNVTDVATSAGWARTAVQWSVDTGLFVGSNGKMNPKAYHLRSQMAVLLQKVDVAYNNVVII